MKSWNTFLFTFLCLGMQQRAGAVLITNGTLSPDSNTEYSSIVELDNIGGYYGTGTFVNSTTVISVGHVLNPTLPGGGVQVDGISAISSFSFPGFHEGHDNNLDMSVIVFPPGTAEKLGITKFYPVSTGLPWITSEVTMVGFSGEQRKVGTSWVLHSTDESILVAGCEEGYWGGFDNCSMVQGGDSGGPALYHDTILGVVNLVTWYDYHRGYSTYVRLNKPAALHLFNDAVDCHHPQYADEVQAHNPGGPCADPIPFAEP
jgi:V8-like Glu-specific endopeptidase